MSGYLRRLATTGAAYTAASILSKLIAVALLPLYTRHLSTTDYGAAEVLFAGVVTASIVVRLGLIEAVLRFYYQRGRGPEADRRRHLLRPLLVLDGRRADRPALRRTAGGSAARPGNPGPAAHLHRTGADRDRRPLGGDAVRIPAHPLPPRRACSRLLPHHDRQRPRHDRADRRPRRRRGGRGPRPPARLLPGRRRLRARDDLRAAPSAHPRGRGAAPAPAPALRPADDARRGQPLPAQLRRPADHRPLAGARRGGPLLAGGEVRPGGERPRPRLPAGLAAARLLDPRRRRGTARLRHRDHPLPRRLHLAGGRALAALRVPAALLRRRRNSSAPTKWSG